MQTSKIYLINTRSKIYITNDWCAYYANRKTNFEKLETKFTSFKRINEDTILICSKLTVNEILEIIRSTGELSFLVLEFDPTINKYTGLLSTDIWDWIQLKTFQIKEELKAIPQTNKVASNV